MFGASTTYFLASGYAGSTTGCLRWIAQPWSAR